MRLLLNKGGVCITLLFLFLLPAYPVFAAWADRECSIGLAYQNTDPPWSVLNTYGYPYIVYDENTGVSDAGTRSSGYVPGQYSYTQVFYYEDGSWYSVGTRATVALTPGYEYPDQWFLVPGSSSVVVSYLNDSDYVCEDFDPDPCVEAGKDPEADCGDIESVTWENVDTCEYHCSTCDDEYAEALSACGESNFSFDDITCEWSCTSCEDQIENADTLCTHGWYWLNQFACIYACNITCVESFNWCNSACYYHGGINLHRCVESAAGIIESAVCECRDGNVENPDPGTDPTDPVDPVDDDPADDPVEDPGDTDQQVGNKWLGAIKENTDTLVGQGNSDADRQEEHTALLDNISDNSKVIADNQTVLNDSLTSIGDKIDNLGEIEVDLDLTKLEDSNEAIKDSLTVDDDFPTSFQSELDAALAADEETQTTDMQDAIGDIFNEYGGVEPEDAGFFSSLFLSIVPPSSTCVPLDMSFQDKEIIVGCNYSAEIKEVMSYFIYILTVLSIYTLVRRELIPKTSA